MAQWDIVKAAAVKLLGPDAEVPDMPDSVQTAADAMGKASGEFDKARADCEAKLLVLENSNDAVRNGLKQLLAKVEKSDFKLNPKEKDNAKKIAQARALLVAKVNSGIKMYNDDDKMLDEVNKHLVQLGNYKPKPGF